MRHPNEKILMQYVSDAITDEEQLRVNMHMARCSKCAERVSTLRYIQNNFDALLNSWTASEHGRVYQQWCLVKALRETVSAEPMMKEHFIQLYEHLAKGMLLYVKVLINRSKNLACIAQGGAPTGYEFQICPAYCGVGSPQAQSKLEKHIKKGSELLSEDKVTEAMEKLLQAKKIDARSSQSARSEVYYGDRLIAEATVDSRRGRISIILWPKPLCAIKAEAVLLPDVAKTEILSTTFEQVEGQPYMLAEFENLKYEVYQLWVVCEVTNKQEL